MRLEQSFEVEAPVEEVWSALIDVERVAPCLPGAEITERDEDGTYHGDFKVRLGPTTAAYRGTLRMESLDADAHVATMRAEGRDKRGQGSAKATIVSRMTEAGGATRVEVETDFSITGKLARFGRGGMIEDISNRLMGDFARCLQTGFEAGAAAAAGREPAEGGETLADSRPADVKPSASPSTAPGRRFTPPAASKPIGGLGLVGSVLFDRLAPVLLPLVRALRRLLERLERALAGFGR
jgi:carbon monoxide dehydrogenase subunit G